MDEGENEAERDVGGGGGRQKGIEAGALKRVCVRACVCAATRVYALDHAGLPQEGGKQRRDCKTQRTRQEGKRYVFFVF